MENMHSSLDRCLLLRPILIQAFFFLNRRIIRIDNSYLTRISIFTKTIISP